MLFKRFAVKLCGVLEIVKIFSNEKETSLEFVSFQL